MLARTPQVVTDLFEVERLIKQHGWCQGASYRLKGICLEYAISLACGDSIALFAPRSLAVVNALKRHLNLNGSHSLSGWNDEPHRIKDDVLDAVQDTAMSLCAS